MSSERVSSERMSPYLVLLEWADTRGSHASPVIVYAESEAGAHNQAHSAANLLPWGRVLTTEEMDS